MQPRLFDRFATGRHRGGTGLGLFIVRELARAQGGDAFYELSSAETSGGAFVIVLPDGSRPSSIVRRSRSPGPGTVLIAHQSATEPRRVPPRWCVDATAP